LVEHASELARTSHIACGWVLAQRGSKSSVRGGRFRALLRLMGNDARKVAVVREAVRQWRASRPAGPPGLHRRQPRASSSTFSFLASAAETAFSGPLRDFAPTILAVPTET
jgi:hypothetical protein